MGLLSHEAVLGTNLGPRSPGSILTLLYKQAINHNIFNLNKIEVTEYINQLEDCCNKNMVEIIKSSEVKKILTHNGNAIGVLLDNGDEIMSKKIISSAGVKNTFEVLLNDENKTSNKSAPINQVDASTGYYCLHIGLNKSAKEIGLNNVETLGIISTPSSAN